MLNHMSYIDIESPVFIFTQQNNEFLTFKLAYMPLTYYFTTSFFLPLSYFPSSSVVGMEDSKMVAGSCIFHKCFNLICQLSCGWLLFNNTFSKKSISFKLSCLHFKCNMVKIKYIVIIPQPWRFHTIRFFERCFFSSQLPKWYMSAICWPKGVMNLTFFH